MGTRVFTREQLEELNVPYSCIHTELTGEVRWGTQHTGVFAFEGRHWQVDYVQGSGDSELDEWDDANEITATEVHRREVTVVETRWVPAGDGA